MEQSEYSILDGLTTPTNCETEPVHVPGCILPHGLLFVVDADTLRLLQASENTEKFGLDPVDKLLGRPVDELLGIDEETKFSQMLSEEQLQETAEWLGEVHLKPDGTKLDLHAHRLGELFYLELEPPVRAGIRLERKLRRLLDSLSTVADLQSFCQRLSEGVWNITGLSRIMVYRFGPDWSGEVIAEATDANAEVRFMGHRFPPMDIPKPARDIYNKIAARFLPSSVARPVGISPRRNPRTGKALDMSRCGLRGASEMYTEYLENMGIASSVTASLKRNGELWGLIACHHHEECFLSPQTRAAFELVSRVVSLQLDRILILDNERLGRERREVCEGLAELTLSEDYSLELVFQKMEELLECDGVAVCSDGHLEGRGLLPEQKEFGEFHVSGLMGSEGRVRHTDALQDLHPPASDWSNDVRGVLALSLGEEFSDCLLWFRKGIKQQIKWGGNPYEKVVKHGKHGPRLHPRSSFETYIETIEGRSNPWTEQELYLIDHLRALRARKLQQRAEELAQLNKRLERANEELDAFAAIASHDLREPLRGITNYVKFLGEDYGEKLDQDGQHMLGRMRFLTKRMEELLNALLEYSRVHKPELRREKVPLKTVVDGALQALELFLEDRRAVIKMDDDLPSIYGHPGFLEEILSNLISNGVKYNRNECPTVVVSGWLNEDGTTTVSVKDDGIGIPEDKINACFELLGRLHGQESEFREGFGLGLAIVKKMVERHEGSIEVRSQEDQGSEFLVTI